MCITKFRRAVTPARCGCEHGGRRPAAAAQRFTSSVLSQLYCGHMRMFLCGSIWFLFFFFLFFEPHNLSRRRKMFCQERWFKMTRSQRAQILVCASVIKIPWKKKTKKTKRPNCLLLCYRKTIYVQVMCKCENLKKNSVQDLRSWKQNKTKQKRWWTEGCRWSPSLFTGRLQLWGRLQRTILWPHPSA